MKSRRKELRSCKAPPFLRSLLGGMTLRWMGDHLKLRDELWAEMLQNK